MTRRRALLVVTVAVLVVAGLVLVLSGRATRPGPAAGPGSATPAAPAGPGPSRPVAYADGQRIHLGTRSIDTHLDVLSLVAAQGGAVFTTFDGAVWFTDGWTVARIGQSTPARDTAVGVQWGAGGRPNGRLVADSSGPDVAWLEYRKANRPVVAVFDTDSLDSVTRLPLATGSGCPACTRIVSVRDGAVYWTDSALGELRVGTRDEQGDSLFRLVVASGRQSTVSTTAYLAELERSPRTVVVGASRLDGVVEEGIGEDFGFVGGRLEVHPLGLGDAASTTSMNRHQKVPP